MTDANVLDRVNALEFVPPTNDAQLHYSYVDSPVGALLLVSDGGALRGLYMDAARYVPTLPVDAAPVSAVHDDATLAQVAEQLDEYFAGHRHSFSFKVAPEGTAFQREVWRALAAIPYGTTRTYGEIAARVGRPLAFRAVGAANSRNPISVVVPCHRVIGADGTLTGYAGGLDRKMSLLDLEQSRAASIRTTDGKR